MRRYGRVSAMWASFYSRDLYRDVAARWKGIGLLYLMLLLAICWLPLAVRWYRSMGEFSRDGVPFIVKQLPTVTMSGGVMSANPPGRHAVRLPSNTDPSGELFLIIDDTIDELPADMPEDVLMLTRREFGMFRPKRGERRVFMLAGVADRVVRPDDVAGWLRSMQLWIPPLGFLGALLGSLAFRFAQLMVYGGVVLFLARRRQLSLDHSTAFRLAAIAVTPVIVGRTVLWIAQADPAWYLRWPAAIAITLLYLRFAVGAVAESAPSAPQSSDVLTGA